MKEHKVTIQRITPKEIRDVKVFLSELAELKDDLNCNFEPEDLDKYEVLSTLKAEDPEDFLYNICAHLEALPIDRLICNCSSVLNNCADMSCETLQFNEKITKGLKLIENQNNMKTIKLNKDNANEVINQLSIPVDVKIITDTKINPTIEKMIQERAANTTIESTKVINSIKNK